MDSLVLSAVRRAARLATCHLGVPSRRHAAHLQTSSDPASVLRHRRRCDVVWRWAGVSRGDELGTGTHRGCLEGWRTVSTSIATGQPTAASTDRRSGRFVRDASGKFVRVTDEEERRGKSEPDGPAAQGPSSGVRAARRDGRGEVGRGRVAGDACRGDDENKKARILNTRISGAQSAVALLGVVRANLRFGLNQIHLATAFSKLGKMAGTRGASVRDLAADETFRRLLREVQASCGRGEFKAQALANTTHGIAKMVEGNRLDATSSELCGALDALEHATRLEAESMNAQAIANTVYAYAKLGRVPREDTWRALEHAAGRQMEDMNAQNISNILYAFALLGQMPGDELGELLENAAERVAQDMTAQGIANTMWAYAKLGRMPRVETWMALENTLCQVAQDMIAQNLSNTIYAYAMLCQVPGDDAWEVLESAVRRLAPYMVPQGVANTLWSYANLGRTPEGDTLEALECATRRVASHMGAQSRRVASHMDAQSCALTIHACAKLGLMPRDDTFVALEAAVVRLANDMNEQDVANTVHACAKLGRLPGDEAWEALERALRRSAPNFSAHAVANILWSYAKLERTLQDATWEALQGAITRVAGELTGQGVANIIWACAKFDRKPENKTWMALESALGRLDQDLIPQEVANTVWAYAKLSQMPGQNTWTRLESAVRRVARDMEPVQVASTVYAFALMGGTPGEETLGALDSAVGRTARDMSARNLSNTAWALGLFSTLHNVEPPACLLDVWSRISEMDASNFSDEGKSMLFHAHLMHVASNSSHSMKLSYPVWLMRDGRDAWVSAAQDATTISHGHRRLAKVFEELGVRHELERVTDDGYFSIDIYLPDHDVAVEFDGPSHYYSYHDDGSSASTQGATKTRTTRTELRDFFLSKQCAKVITVPWFEFDPIKMSPENRKLYVKEKLSKEAGIEV